MKRAALYLAIAVLAAAGGGLAIRRQANASGPGDRPTARARKGEFLVIVTCRGELVADQALTITAPTKVPDLRITWMAEPGKTVKAGDTVVRFDNSSAKRQIDEQQAALNQSQASLEQAQAEARLAAERDTLELADAREAIDKARLNVAKADVVSQLQAEEYKLDLKLAEERMRVKEAAAKMNRTSAESKIAAARAQRDKNQAALDVTRDRLNRMAVVAPSAGLLTFLMNYSRGWMNAAQFKVGDSIWPGSEIAEIPDLATLQMKAKLEEMDRSRLTLGQNVRIVLDAFPEKPFAGKLARISPLVEQNFEWPPTRNFRAFGTFDELDARLRPAMNGRMDVIVDRIAAAICVPAKAVFTRKGTPVVLVAEGNRLRTVEVTVVARNPDEVAVSGIREGDSVSLVDEQGGAQ